MNLKGNIDDILKGDNRKEIAFDVVGKVANCVQESANHLGRPVSVSIDMSQTVVNDHDQINIRGNQNELLVGNHNRVNAEMPTGDRLDKLTLDDLLKEIVHLRKYNERIISVCNQLYQEKAALQGKIIMLYENGSVTITAHPNQTIQS